MLPTNSPHSAAAPAPLLRLHQLTKRYANGVLANDAVSLEVAAGTVHALVGENGAGKSTVLKMLYGLEQPDAGRIELAGRAQIFRRPADAIAAGIGLVPQHLHLWPSMSVAENIVLGSEPTRGPWLAPARARSEVVVLARQYGLAIDPDAAVGGLAAGAQQRVEILKALRRGARLLLLDEPTALLTPQEAHALFGSLRALVAQGLTVVLITHKMAEVREVCDGYTVLRGGRVVGAGTAALADSARIAEAIVGRALVPSSVERVDARGRPPRLKVRGLSLLRPRGRAELTELDFDVAAGEILGIAGVEGNGQNRLADVLTGLAAPSLGEACLDGRRFTGLAVRQVRRHGIGSVPEDRLAGGVAPSMSVADNCAALDYGVPPLSRFGLLNLPAMRERARQLMRRFGVAARDEQVAIGSLSGGNMQKVVLGRELLAKPRLLIASQPTRGVDIGAAQGLRRAIVELRDAGAAVLLLSADLDEIFELSDRIAVLFEGQLVAHFRAGQVTPGDVGRCMTGLAGEARAAARLDSPLTVLDAGAGDDLSQAANAQPVTEVPA